MYLGACPGINAETNSETVEGIFDYSVVLVNDFLRRTSQILGLESDRNAMLVASANEKHVFSLEAEITHIDVCRNINSGEMADVNASVGVWKRGGNEMSLEFLFHVSLFSKFGFSEQPAFYNGQLLYLLREFFDLFFFLLGEGEQLAPQSFKARIYHF